VGKNRLIRNQHNGGLGRAKGRVCCWGGATISTVRSTSGVGINWKKGVRAGNEVGPPISLGKRNIYSSAQQLSQKGNTTNMYRKFHEVTMYIRRQIRGGGRETKSTRDGDSNLRQRVGESPYKKGLRVGGKKDGRKLFTFWGSVNGRKRNVSRGMFFF